MRDHNGQQLAYVHFEDEPGRLQSVAISTGFRSPSEKSKAGLMAMLTRMQMGKPKVFKHLNDWFEEFRLYHRKDGKVVKEGDDLMAATRPASAAARAPRAARRLLPRQQSL